LPQGLTTLRFLFVSFLPKPFCMSFRKILLPCLISALLLSGCENLPKTTKSGLRYIIHSHKSDARKAKSDEFLMINLVVKTSGDSVLRSTYTQDKHPLPQQAPPDTIKDGYLGEAIAMLAEGDSATFLFSADSLFAKSGQPMPPAIAKGSDIRYTFKVEKILKLEDAKKQMEVYQKSAMADAEKAAVVQKQTDDKIIVDYLAKNKITNAIRTESGLHYVITQEGTGNKPEKGNIVVVNYTGKLMDGKTFDTNLKGEGSKPAEFPIGVGAVIPGWDEALLLLKKGSKVNLYLPSTIAYGAAGSNGVIPANAVLMFEVELLDIKPAPNNPSPNNPTQ
jgi:FKBP-type peptidyl-prolyl cis-trans isomerase FkpA